VLFRDLIFSPKVLEVPSREGNLRSGYFIVSVYFDCNCIITLIRVGDNLVFYFLEFSIRTDKKNKGKENF